MSFGEVINFPNYGPPDAWSDGRSSSCSSSQSSDSGNSLNFSSKDFGHGFNTFSDTFGLSNLLSNVQISDDNPLLQSTQKNLSLLQRARRQSWGSDGSDNAAVLSPTIESQPNYDRFDLNNNINTDKFLQQHHQTNNMRFGGRNIRDLNLINNAYPPQNENRPSAATDKLIKPPLILPSSPTAPNLPNPLTMPPPQTQQPTTTTPPSIAGPNNRGGNNSNNNGVHVCVFCRNNGESESVYTSHVLKDGDGRTSCPILRAYTCPICKANGDNSHTIKYCPMNQNAGLFPRPGQQQQPSFRTPFPPPPPPPNMPMGNQFPNFQRNKNSFR